MYNIKMRQDFSVFVETPLIKGGLIVCGLNWGAAKGHDVPNETDVPTWHSATFYNGCNRADPEFDPFRGNVAELFLSFGYNLSKNSALDKAIIPTNLFYNKTCGCSKGTFVEANWESAVKRLFNGAESLKASGILITGMSARDYIWRFMVSENRGTPLNWQENTQKTSGLKIGKFKDIPFMITYHYAYLRRQRVKKTLNLMEMHEPMREWLKMVLPDIPVMDTNTKKHRRVDVTTAGQCSMD